MLPGTDQSVQAQDSPQKKHLQYPIANQFEHLSMEDGLSNNSITAILQDSAGFMWFGTREGLNKYDSHTFTVFQPDPKQPNYSFRDSYIRGLCEGSSGQIWAATALGGLHEVNQKTGVVISHPIPAAQDNRWNQQHSVYRDSRNGIWVSTSAGLARYEPTQHHFTLYPSPETDISVVTTLEDRQHRLWVATVRGLYLLNRATGRFTLVPVQVPTGRQPYFTSIFQDKHDRLWLGTATAGYSLFRLNLLEQPWRLEPYNPGGRLAPFVWRNTIHQDAVGIVWVGTTNGLYAIDPVSDSVVTYHTDPNLTKGLASSNASAVYHDRSGMLWVGTDNCVDRQAINTKPFRQYQVRPNERLPNVPENKVNAVCKDKLGQLWYSNTDTVYRLAPGQSKFDIIPPEELGTVGTHKNAVYALFPDDSTGLWFGTADGLYHYDLASGRYTSYPSEIPAHFIDRHRIPNGLLWIGGEGGIASFNPRTHQYTYHTHKPGATGGLPGNDIDGLMVTQFGEVWVLLNQQGIWRFNPNGDKITRHTAGSRGFLNSNAVLSIHEDNSGIIWIGTHLGGVNRFDWRTGLFSAITRQQGIPGNRVVSITSDEWGYVWLGTDDGLCRLDSRTKTIHSYKVTDGLISNDFLPNAVFRSSGQLFFGTESGVVQFNPSRVLDDIRPFPVYITELIVEDRPRPISDRIIRLKHDENRLSFAFAALAYEQPDRNQYACQLLGVDQTWVQHGNDYTASYNSLPPGTYTFRVKAANSNGFWTKNIASVQVIVAPPWWATWWAYSLYVLLASGAIWGYISFYTNRIRQQQESAFNRRQAEQLKAIDELKTRFFANITHEFRTPLSLIIAPVEKLLQENRFDRPALTLVQRNAGRLLRLINQLLDLSKLEDNHMAVSLMQGDVTDFINHGVEVFRRSAEQQDVTLTGVVKLPPQAYAFDADKWEKILTNLLSNALKFTAAGGQVTVRAALGRETDEEVWVQIDVVDTGIGIAPDELPHIFDRFYQADSSSTRAYGGTGIGLALVHELVGLLGGTITVESILGLGTTFRLTLPLQPVSVATSTPALSWSMPRLGVVQPLSELVPALNKLSSMEPMPMSRILIVEDNDELRAFLAGELTPAHQVLQAPDGEAGWALVQTELPDIVLTDVMMPRMDGFELTRLIRNNPATNHIAVVMLTAKAAQPSRLEGLQQGADDYLAKPFSVDELRLRLRNLITRQQKLGDYYRQQFALPDVILAQGTESALDKTDPFLLGVYALLDNNLDDASIGVDWLADQLAMSRKTLYRKVQSLIQLPPAELIRQYRLRKAAELLRSGHNVSETAYLTGFSTPSHLAALFRETYGQTPTEFMAHRA